MRLIDTHCHLNFKAFDEDFLGVAQRAVEAGVEGIVVPGADSQTSPRAVKVCRAINEKSGRDFARAAVGIHPIKLTPSAESNGANPIHFDHGVNLAEIERLAKMPEVVAIGECGLDQYREKNPANLEKQKELFGRFIDLALEVQKPLIIHNREADEEMLETLQARRKLPKMVFHCFSSDWNFAQKVLELGAYISFTGNITYGAPLSKEINRDVRRSISEETRPNRQSGLPRAKADGSPTSPFAKAMGDKSLKLRGAGSSLKVVERVPIEKTMIETDAPYIVPEPEKSSGVVRNEPAYVIEVARKIAEIRGEDFEKICTQTTENAREFFSL